MHKMKSRIQLEDEASAKRMKRSQESLLASFVENRRLGHVVELACMFPNFVAPIFPVLVEDNYKALLERSLDIMRLVPDALVLHTRCSFAPVLPGTVQNMAALFTSLSHASVWMTWIEQALTKAQAASDIDQLQFLWTENLETKIQTYSLLAQRCMRAYREELKAYVTKEKELGLHVPTPPPLPSTPVATIAQRILQLKLDECGVPIHKGLIVLIAEYGA